MLLSCLLVKLCIPEAGTAVSCMLLTVVSIARLRERELVGKDVFVGAYLQSQDLQRQFSRRQDEIDAENMALADKLERAVQAATVDAAEKKSLQVQC